MRVRAKRAFSLVEIMVVVVILMIIAAVVLPKYLRGEKTTAGKVIQGSPQTPIQRGKEVDCLNNRNQIRQAWQLAIGTGEEESRPRSLADLRQYGISDAMTRCTVGKEPFQFNPATGEVRCVHPGHR